MNTIDIRNNNLIPDEFMIFTKAGRRWRPNWTAMVAAKINIVIHNSTYTLINRIKKENKWYLVFTDGTNNYIERQDKAKRNKKLAKDTIIQTVKRVIAGLLPEPKELIDQLIEQVERLVQQYNEPFINNPANYTSKGKLKNRIANILYPKFNEFNCNDTFLNTKIRYINYVLKFLHIDNFINTQQCKDIYKQLKIAYHPDRTHTDTIQQFQLVQRCFNWI